MIRRLFGRLLRENTDPWWPLSVFACAKIGERLITFSLNRSFNDMLMVDKLILKASALKIKKINSYIIRRYSFTKIQLADEMQGLN